MAAISSSSSSLSSPNFTQNPSRPLITIPSKLHFHRLAPQFSPLKFTHTSNPKKLAAVAEDTSVNTADPSSSVSRRLYVGNIPRTVTNDELQKIVEEHGAVEKAEVMYDKYSVRSRPFAFVTMKTLEDANAAVEKLNGTEIGGRQIKVNVTEKPLESSSDSLILQSEETQFVDSPHKVYVGNLAKTVTTDILKDFFAAKGKVLSAKVARLQGTSKSSGYGFVSFSSEEDVEAAITSLNNEVLEGQKIRVNKSIRLIAEIDLYYFRFQWR